MLTVILSLYPKVFNAQQKYLGWRPSPRCQSGTRSPEQMWQNVKCEKCKVGRAPETGAQTLATLPLLPLSPTITFGNWTRGRPIIPSIGIYFLLNFGQTEAGNGIVISILRICTFYSGNTLSSRWTPGEWCLYILIPWRSPSSPARSGQLRRGPAHGSRRLSCPWRCGTLNIVCRSLLQYQAKMTQQCLQMVDGVLVLVCMGITMMLI